MELPLMCGACAEPTRADGIGKSANIGCCEDCDIRVMCKDCGTWDEEQEIWRCPDCQEQYDLLICGCCDQRVADSGCGDMVNHGCCSDGRCEHEPKIEVLCGECGTWDEEDEVWRCPDCQEQHEAKVEWEKREKCPCGLTLSDDDMALEKVHDVRLCEGCYEENKKAHDYCPVCNELTNTKNSCCSRTCCVCLEETFCEKCVKDCEDKDCNHDWQTHCVCAKCA